MAQALGWRAVFGLGAGVNALIAVLLWRALPVLRPTVTMRYPALLASVLRLLREEPVLRLRTLYGALCFASFSAFWTSLGFLLARPPYHWGNAAIGAFALLGAAGAIAARFTGRLADAGAAHRATGAFFALLAGSYLLIALGARSAAALGAGVVLMDLGCQGAHILNQSLIYPLRPAARSRLNTAYMVSYFLAGAAGSGLSATCYAAYGWGAVCVLGAEFPTVAFMIWVVERYAARRAARRQNRQTPVVQYGTVGRLR